MLTLYNSLSRKKEKFTTINKHEVKMYICGITPYDTTHLGHAFTYISFDALIKYLKFIGLDVSYTQNVTDINDRDNDILKRAQEQKVTWQNLSAFWTKKFLTDMKNLNWNMPTNYLYASENIKPMIKIVQRLLENGIAYQVGGSVYLDVSKDKDFGKLSKFSKEKMLKIANDFEEDTTNPDKKHQLDITLWRESDPNQSKHIPSFKSPFGLGRPGWHLECSAMSISSLGEQIDIHGGGIDLIYPHHEAEIAQSEEATKKIPFAKFWVHAGIVAYKGMKMSKSDNNLVMISDLLKKYSSNSIRYVLLSHHYRNGWEFFEKDLKTAEEEFKKITQQVSRNKSKSIDFKRKEIVEFRNIMDMDLNTPKALRLASSLALNIKSEKNLKNKENLSQSLRTILSVLGFVL